MKRVTLILFNSPPGKDAALTRLLESLGFSLPYNEFGYALRLDPTDPRIPLLEAGFRANGIIYEITSRPVFSEADMESAEFLQLIVRVTCGKSYEYPGLYDMSSGCAKCGGRGRQLGELRIDKHRVGTRDIVETYTGDIVVSEGLRDSLVNCGLTGVRTRGVEHYAKWKSRKPEPKLFQLLPEIILPPMAPQMVFNRDRSRLACPACHSGLTWRDDLPFVYGPGIREVAGDLLWTHEQFGWVFKERVLIVSQRAFRMLRAKRVKRVEFRPVEILDHSGTV